MITKASRSGSGFLKGDYLLNKNSEKFKSFFHLKMFVPGMVKIGTVVLKKMKHEMCITITTTTKAKDNGQILIRKSHFGLPLR